LAFTLLASATAFDTSGYDWTESLGSVGEDTAPTLSWTVDSTLNTGKFAIRCPATTGWCGFGVSPSGGMKLGDFVVGYLHHETGEPVVEDYNHLEDFNGMPTVDLSSQLTETGVVMDGEDMIVR